MHYATIPTGSFAANCTVLWNEGSAECWVVDPGPDVDAIERVFSEHRLKPVLVAFTHGHFDHIGGVPALLARYPGLPLHIAPGDLPMVGNPLNAWPPDYPAIARPAGLVADLEEGFTLAAGGIAAKVLATPGHSPGSVCLYFAAEELLLSGDTLFAGSCGRTDFPGGSFTQMQASLQRLAKLPGGTVVVPGHGPATTIAAEVKSNPYMN